MMRDIMIYDSKFIIMKLDPSMIEKSMKYRIWFVDDRTVILSGIRNRSDQSKSIKHYIFFRSSQIIHNAGCISPKYAFEGWAINIYSNRRPSSADLDFGAKNLLSLMIILNWSFYHQSYISKRNICNILDRCRM